VLAILGTYVAPRDSRGSMRTTEASRMPALSRRLTVLVAASALLFGAVAVRPGSVAAAMTVSQAEQAMVSALNADRATAGIVAARVDSRLMSIARARSTDMATKHYFSHTQPDGRTVFKILTAQRITWYNAGEIIAWNTWPELGDSVNVANSGWMGSSVHRAIIMSASFNYVGVGLAIDGSGKKLWTAVFMKGPDRTGGWVAMDPVAQTASVSTASSTSRIQKISWRGGDVQLSVLTAGFLKYQIQRSLDGGAYVWMTTSTTTPSRTFTLYAGRTYTFRIRACDKVGNCGAWRYITVRF
jgi:uncharacterized protein YkwD